MSSSRDVVAFQAKRHEIVRTAEFRNIEEYLLFLIHLKAYEEAASRGQGKTVLDIGCNNGYGTAVIAANCRKAVGIDVSPRAIREAQRMFASKGIEFQLVDGKRLPFEDASFDLVTCYQVIEHIGDCGSFLSEIKRVLARGACLLIATPNARIRLDSTRKPWNPLHVREFNAGELLSLLRTYFHDVRLQGLSAKEPLYSIELGRMNKEKARFAARRMSPLRTKIKGILPGPVLSGIRAALDGVKRVRSRASDSSLLQRYSTADLFYRDDDLDNALDLMAICHRGNW